jgi:uncharacterized membrane protein YgcG
MKLKPTMTKQARFHLAVPGERPRYGALARSGGLGELTVRAATLRFQKFYNILYADNQATTDLPTALRLTGGTVTEDGRYGSRETQPAMERVVNLWVRIGACTGTSSYDVRRNGPAAARLCLLAAAFSPPEVSELQAAWLEMKGRQADLTAGGGGGGDGGGGGQGGGGGGGTPDDVPEADMPALPAPKDAGVFGLILFGIDLVGGFVLGRVIK